MADRKRPDLSGGAERRAHPRLAVEGVSGAFRFSTHARILNLSLDGVALETSDYLQIGRSYSLKLTQGDEELMLRGRIVWCQMVGTSRAGDGDTAPVYSVGVQFENLMSGTAREVHRFLGANAVVSLEKRLYGRFRLRGLETADVDCQATFRVATISLSGMEIESDTPVEPEAVLDLEIRLGDRPLKIIGRVVHGLRLEPESGAESATLLGIEFVDMNEEAERAIRELIRSAIR